MEQRAELRGIKPQHRQPREQGWELLALPASSLPVAPISNRAWGERQQEGLVARGSAGWVLVEPGLCRASAESTQHTNCVQHVETVMGCGQPGSTGWLKWSETGGSRDVLRWALDLSGGRWEWKPQYQALPNLGEVLSPPDSKFVARSHLSFSPSELPSPRKPTLLRLL